LISRIFDLRLGPMPAAFWAALAGYAGLLYGVNLDGAHALTDHEAYVGGLARQMAGDGSWGMLLIGDRPWLEKPPLPHWLAALSGAVFGFSEWSVRLPSALAGIGVVLIVAGLAARCYGAAAGLIAGLVQASCFYMLRYARLAEADMLLCLLVTAALAIAFVLGDEPEMGDRRARRLSLAFWLLLGLCNLAKGPLLGAGIVVSAGLAWAALRWDATLLRRLWNPAGIALMLAIWAAWPLMVWAQGYGEALASAWGDHILGRVSGDFTSTAKPVWHYATTIPLQTLPWVIFLPLGLWAAFRQAGRDRRAPARFFLAWALVPVLLLSIPQDKHHHYIIHALPGLSPFMALGILRLGDGYRAMPDRWRRLLALTGLAGAAAAAVGSAVAGFVLPELSAHIWWPGGIVAAMLAASALLLRRGRVAGMAAAVFLAVLAIGVVLRSDLVPRRDPSGPDRVFLSRIDDLVPADARLIGTGGPDIARFVFYIDRPMARAWSLDEAGEAIGQGEPAFVLVRAREEPALHAYGSVIRVAQSERARFERSPRDRYTLYRVDPRR
jgi:4-amino-4-deoxy-L-arabinose transferase-like glycosyltransferase